ncbi:pyruvate dehydrogenase [Nonomuraea sp. NPDC048916]|uniref:transketolase-like TK C-terminal-containing protein n=1 Tax=Nonomuraea sp. NPDC048916 TaxID=3154232 RepID=UPI0033F549CB
MTALPISPPDIGLLHQVEDRVLWLSAAVVHHANTVRPSRSGVKVGGHQTSSASMTSIMTSLWFTHLSADDLVSVKPHAAPALHAINYLLGDLDPRYLTELRAYGGLQSYPSRRKDPDRVDFSTGSVGIGATAAVWSSLSNRYAADHLGVSADRRHISLLGDAELDEGACWEAVADPLVGSLGRVLWVVDLNRQSLDRVIPGIEADRRIRMFEGAGWHVQVLKYGTRLQEIFRLPGGQDLRRRLDAMTNEEYQRLLRLPTEQLRERLPGNGPGARAIAGLMSELDEETLYAGVRNLGGHDLQALTNAYRGADLVSDRPSVVFAYTVKGWRLPGQGHPRNHSALISAAQYEQLARDLGADPEDPWRRFPEDSPEAALCEATGRRLMRAQLPSSVPPTVPPEVSNGHRGRLTTQQSLGRVLLDLSRRAPDVARRVVTVSPDVASSTNLGGWINKVGVWSAGERANWFSDDPDSVLRWDETPSGQHIPLGIAEVNLVGLLGELGATWSRYGQPLLPIGTIYDPFVARALEPWSFAIYAGGQFILVGTPSGVTLAPEGGAHQSITTPSLGLEQPECVSWEPAFAMDLEWILMHALSRIGRRGGESAYLRLSTRPVDQSLALVPAISAAREARRRAVLSGGYLLQTLPGADGRAVTLVGVGAVLPEVIAAAESLNRRGVAVDLVCLTSPDLIYRAWRTSRGLSGDGDPRVLDELFPGDDVRPIVAVIDGHPHTIDWLGAIRGAPIATLGVDGFGQSGDVPDLYRHFGIDSESIVSRALSLISH